MLCEFLRFGREGVAVDRFIPFEGFFDDLCDLVRADGLHGEEQEDELIAREQSAVLALYAVLFGFEELGKEPAVVFGGVEGEVKHEFVFLRFVLGEQVFRLQLAAQV